MTAIAELRAEFDQLNRDYLAVHKTKEDLFWDTYMAVSDDHDSFARAEAAYKTFISSPERLVAVRAALERLRSRPAPSAMLLHGYQGWLALFESNIVDSAAAQQQMRRLIEMEAELFAKRRDLALSHINERGEREEATLTMLAINMATNPDLAARKSSHDALLDLERWVLANGFLDIVKQRNALARNLGSADYFEYKVRKNEQMTPQALFAVLDDFEARTRDANRQALRRLAEDKGEDALQPYNLRFHMSGDA